jgi:hypothetical protein
MASTQALNNQEVKYGFLDPQTNVFYAFSSEREYLMFLEMMSSGNLTEPQETVEAIPD